MVYHDDSLNSFYDKKILLALCCVGQIARLLRFMKCITLQMIYHGTKHPLTQNELMSKLKENLVDGVRLLKTLTDCANPHFEDRKSTRLNSSHSQQSRMPSSA